jgi:hypothetical protein
MDEETPASIGVESAIGVASSRNAARMVTGPRRAASLRVSGSECIEAAPGGPGGAAMVLEAASEALGFYHEPTASSL